jgi:23S rRNA (adenine2030-N6)-methyltransferase
MPPGLKLAEWLRKIDRASKGCLRPFGRLFRQAPERLLCMNDALLCSKPRRLKWTPFARCASVFHRLNALAGSLVMLSYRHAFHAGNHADVLKHAVVVQMLRYLGQKDKPYWYIDTHSGAGVYSLTEGFATKNAEYETGIGPLWDRADLPPLLADYVDEVKALNADGTLQFYPGSPYLAYRLMREQDRMRLYELHSTEIDVLRHNFRDAGRRTMIYDSDGFEGIKAILPPPPRRALVLIDPSYEDKRDYARTLTCLEECLKRFATGTYAVWYPIVTRPESQRFADQLKAIQPNGWLHASLTVKAPPADGFGLYGSGMFILNPPYTLAAELKTTLPFLVDALGEDANASFKLEHRGN